MGGGGPPILWRNGQESQLPGGLLTGLCQHPRYYPGALGAASGCTPGEPPLAGGVGGDRPLLTGRVATVTPPPVNPYLQDISVTCGGSIPRLEPIALEGLRWPTETCFQVGKQGGWD